MFRPVQRIHASGSSLTTEQQQFPILFEMALWVVLNLTALEHGWKPEFGTEFSRAELLHNVSSGLYPAEKPPSDECLMLGA